MTMASGRMAPSVFSVSTRDSPFDNAGGLRRDRYRVRAQAFRREFETGAGARGSFKEQIHHHAPLQKIEVAKTLRRELVKWRARSRIACTSSRVKSSMPRRPWRAARPFYTLSTSNTFSMPSISLNFTSMISLADVCTVRPM